LTDERKKSNHNNWVSCFNYLEKFTDGSLYFGELNEKFCSDFRRFLLNSKSFRSEKSKLSQNSALSYYNKFKAALNQAFADGYIQSDLSRKVEGIKPVEIRRNFLTMEELNKLAKCETDHKLMKRAALFSALTGLRYSDIEKLKWKEVEVIEGEGYFLNFKQQKTKGIEVLPISEQAFQLMGVRRNPDEKVFQGLSDRDRYYHFPVWVSQAGITKEVTFHCLRHTFATLQLTKGTDIYTVSKLLGHRELKTTQVYAKIIDQTKRDAVNKIIIEF
jgi:integrase